MQRLPTVGSRWGGAGSHRLVPSGARAWCVAFLCAAIGVLGAVRPGLASERAESERWYVLRMQGERADAIPPHTNHV